MAEMIGAVPSGLIARHLTLRRVVGLVGLGLIALNWPLVLLAVDPGGGGEKAALAVAVCAAVALTYFGGGRLRRVKAERFAWVISAAGFLSILAVFACLELGNARRALGAAVGDDSDAAVALNDAAPRWDSAGVAQKVTLSAIPGTAIEITVCAAPIQAANRRGSVETTLWLIETTERRSWPYGVERPAAGCAEAPPTRLLKAARLPESPHSSLIDAAIRDSAARYGVVPAQQPIFLTASWESDSTLRRSAYGYTASLVALNAIYLILAGFAARSLSKRTIDFRPG